MNNSIRFLINKQFNGIDIESLKQDNIMYSIFMIDLIKKVDNLCDLYKQNKVDIYQEIGSILYKK